MNSSRLASFVRTLGISLLFCASHPPLSSQEIKPNLKAEDTSPIPGGCLLANGFAYGPFRDGEGPGDPLPFPSRDQIDEDLSFLSKVSNRVRIYASSGKYGDIPGMAKQHGLNVMIGVNLSPDPEADQREIDAAIDLARDQLTLPTGERVNIVDAIIVGNETLSSSSNPSGTSAPIKSTAEQKRNLIESIRKVRRGLGPIKIPVSTAQTAAVWESNLDLAGEVDFVTAHFYPFWDRKPVEGAADAVIEAYRKLRADLRGKYGRDVRVVIGETGWPSGGGSLGKAVPSPQNQRKYTQEFMRRACSESITFYYFEAFDEEWKWREGGEEEWKQLQGRTRLRSKELPDDRTFNGRWIGSSWGIFQSDGKLKPSLSGMIVQPVIGRRADRDIFLEGSLLGYYDMGVDSWPDHRHDWVSTGNDTDGKGSLRMAYPANQMKGAVFITVGEPTQSPRPYKDFSNFTALSLELRADQEGSTVEIGIKSRTDPNNGKETRYRETLSTTFRPYRIPLTAFRSPYFRPQDLKTLNVVVEFVFEGPGKATVYARNLRYDVNP